MRVAPRGGRWRANLKLLWALSLYWISIYPRTRAELRRWSERAEAIPDLVLRAHALAKLRSERMVLEGAAAFALLAARPHRVDVIRACVTFEIVYELTDVLGEQPVEHPLAHNERLNRALVSAVVPLTPHEAHLLAIGERDPDYLHELIDACRTALMRLPGHAAILPTVQRLAALAAHAQTLNHGEPADRQRLFAAWATSCNAGDATWWEFAAAASSPLGIFALFAAASRSGLEPEMVVMIDAAYFPWIGAVVWLMESLVDHLEDACSDNLSYFGQYGSTDEAARRLVAVTARAYTAARSLPDGELHTILFTGAVGLYLSKHEARHRSVRPVAEAIRESLPGPIGPLMAVSRLRRLAQRLSGPRRRGHHRAARRRWRARCSPRRAGRRR
ncbi:MAG: DUF2600 family protein [Actinobacteria bacterium]|nr:DUF2600 family protein [Actinomycetota bacterium]